MGPLSATSVTKLQKFLRVKLNTSACVCKQQFLIYFDWSVLLIKETS